MATDYGTDAAAFDTLPDPDVLVSGETNVAYALARRLITPDGALEEVGETEPYASLDVRECLGERMTAQDVQDLQRRITRCLTQDPRVLSIDVLVSFNAGVLNILVAGAGTEGPFRLVLVVSALSVKILVGG